MTSVDPRTPVLVGAGLIQQRVEDPLEAAEPLALMIGAARDAAVDAGAPKLLASIDRVLVPIGRWNYGDPGRLIATALGSPMASTVAALAGVSQQTILSNAATAIAERDITTALVVGGEAGYRDLRARITGIEVTSTEPVGEADEVLRLTDPVMPSHERDRGLGVMPVGYYAVMETAWRHARGLGLEQHAARAAERYAEFSRVAAANPHGWDEAETTADQIRAARTIAYPYGRHHVSNWSVDQASALILTSVENARALGIDESRWVFPQAFTEANHVVDVAARTSLDRCVGAEIAGPAALDAAACTVADLDLIELYTCFPFAIESYAEALGVPEDRTWSFTGAMPFGGGPFNNFVLHTTAQAARQLREGPGRRALVTTVSGVLTKQGFAVWGTQPNPNGYRFVDRTADTAAATQIRPIDADYAGPAVVAGYTVMHSKAGPEAGVAVVDTASGARSVASTTDPALMAEMEADEFCGRNVEVDGPALTMPVP